MNKDNGKVFPISKIMKEPNLRMFKACRICMDTLFTINNPSGKLSTTSDQLFKCPLKPTCSGQPERIRNADTSPSTDQA